MDRPTPRSIGVPEDLVRKLEHRGVNSIERLRAQSDENLAWMGFSSGDMQVFDNALATVGLRRDRYRH